MSFETSGENTFEENEIKSAVCTECGERLANLLPRVRVEHPEIHAAPFSYYFRQEYQKALSAGGDSGFSMLFPGSSVSSSAFAKLLEGREADHFFLQTRESEFGPVIKEGGVHWDGKWQYDDGIPVQLAPYVRISDIALYRFGEVIEVVNEGGNHARYEPAYRRQITLTLLASARAPNKYEPRYPEILATKLEEFLAECLQQVKAGKKPLSLEEFDRRCTTIRLSLDREIYLSHLETTLTSPIDVEAITQACGEGYCRDHMHRLAPKVLFVMNDLVHQRGFTVLFSSTFRDSWQNAKVGGDPNSRHMGGDAVDISQHSQVPGIPDKRPQEKLEFIIAYMNQQKANGNPIYRNVYAAIHDLKDKSNIHIHFSCI